MVKSAKPKKSPSAKQKARMEESKKFEESSKKADPEGIEYGVVRDVKTIAEAGDSMYPMGRTADHPVVEEGPVRRAYEANDLFLGDPELEINPSFFTPQGAMQEIAKLDLQARAHAEAGRYYEEVSRAEAAKHHEDKAMKNRNDE